MSYSEETMKFFREHYDYGVAVFKEKRRQSVELISPYSRKINAFIRTTKELQVYMDLNLIETTVTRPTLILDIDPCYSDKSGKTNLEKMLSGKSPLDSVTGDVIDLHHIGQEYGSPFAELPHSVHEFGGNYSVLHTTNASWRNNKELVKLTTSEIANYWKMRGKMFHEKL